jgi:hypothetical protein
MELGVVDSFLSSGETAREKEKTPQFAPCGNI